MKTRITFLTALLIAIVSYAQQGINYKAVVKDDNGNLVTNQSVFFYLVIYEGAALQNPVYTETHTINTDSNGIAVFNIGEGMDSGAYNFEDINWGQDEHFLNVQVNIGNGLVDLGTMQFMAVPYAKVAEVAENVTGLEALDEGNGIGWRLKGRDSENYGDLGDNAVDLSYSDLESTTYGATGQFSNALGTLTTASGYGALASGQNTTASGFLSTSLGSSTIASGDKSLSVGEGTNASDSNSMASGFFTTASGFASFAAGFQTVAEATASTAIGLYNVGGGTSTGFIDTNPVFEIGNGSSDDGRSNALTVLYNGTITAPSFDISEITDDKALITKEYLEANSASKINDLEDGKFDGSSLFLGEDAGLNDTGTFNINTAVGFSALKQNLEGYANTALGYAALSANSDGFNNTAIGGTALLANTTGNNNTAIGAGSLQNSTSGNSNTAMGSEALFSTTGSNNTAIGTQALKQHTSGTDNVAIGHEALEFNLSGFSNTAVGEGALKTSTSSLNTAIGQDAFSNLTSGENNIGIGWAAVSSSPTVNNEVTIGNFSHNSYRIYAASWTNASDRNLKHSIHDISVGLDFVLKLRPVEFIYNNANNEQKTLGFIAQEVKDVVKQSNLSENTLVTPLNKDFLGLRTTELISVLTKAIQEQQDIIEQKSNAINDLTARLERLEAIVLGNSNNDLDNKSETKKE